MSTPLSTQTPIQRHPWTEAERQAVRDYAATHPGTTWRYIKRWFESTYPSKQITQSQISKFINSKRPRVPSDSQIGKLQPTTKRLKTGKHPELDAALFEWQQVMQKRKIAVSGLLLQEKAAQFWD